MTEPTRSVQAVLEDDEIEIPPDLLDPPSTISRAPVETALQGLPLGRLSPEGFERLCLRLARLEGTPYRARRYGVRGQTQYGIDIYSRLPSGRYATYQCKRYQQLNPSDVEDAVDTFLKGRWESRVKSRDVV